MFAIGKVSELTGVKVPTLRYYEEIGLLAHPDRNGGGQRRYSKEDVRRITFIKHGRELGFSIAQLRPLLGLAAGDGDHCSQAHTIVSHNLRDVRSKIEKLTRLEKELERMSHQTDVHCAETCLVLNALSDHDNCLDQH